jgi:hypothetical protein
VFHNTTAAVTRFEAAGPVALLLEAAVADFPQAVEEYGTSQRVARFALVQPGVDTAAQFDALQPVQDCCLLSD